MRRNLNFSKAIGTFIILANCKTPYIRKYLSERVFSRVFRRTDQIYSLESPRNKFWHSYQSSARRAMYGVQLALSVGCGKNPNEIPATP